MKHVFFLTLLCVTLSLVSCAPSVSSNPEIARIDSAVVVAKNTHRQVLCQMGGDWCKWCRLLNQEIASDTVLSQFIDEFFIYIHVTYNGKDDPQSQALNDRLQDAARFGFPVWVILNQHGNIVHIQNTAYLESGFGYDHQRLLDCLNDWK